jgi:hypothetical protein
MTLAKDPRPSRSAVRPYLLTGAIVGLAVGCLALDSRYILGTGGKWIHPRNDLVAYLVAWNYYIVDHWRLPLFTIPSMTYPEGGSVLFSDALPLTALATKAVYHASGIRVNPFGWWTLVTYVLQGAAAARLVCAAGVRSHRASMAAAVLAIVNVAFVERLGHTAVSSHFLVIWALAVHLDSVRQGRWRAVEATAVLALTLLVNAYLFAMVAALQLAALVTLWIRGQLTRQDLSRAAIGAAGTALLGMVAGYGVLLTNPATMKAQGFGHYSWNLATLLVPPGGLLGFLTHVTRDATGGQYEGEAYVGLGALLLLVLCLVTRLRQMAASVSRYRVYVATILLCAAYAASNVIYVGGAQVVSYPLPSAVIDIGNYFRASGRFIWPLSYSLSVLPLACLFRWWRPGPAVAAAFVAVLLQVHEATPDLQRRRQQMGEPNPPLIDTALVKGWLARHERVWQVPSWDCGGLGRARRVWGSPEANAELEIQLAAAELGVPSNSAYTSRTFKDCGPELAWAANPRLDEGTLHLIGLASVETSPAIAALARSNACVTLDWGVVCSQSWLRLADDRAHVLRNRER